MQASGYSGWWLLLTHIAALLALSLTPLPVWMLVFLATLVLSSLWWCWPRYASRQHRDAVRVFTWKEGCDCIVVRGSGELSSCELTSRAFVMPWLVILYYRQGRRLQSLFILPDMLERDAFRRLRVRLRMAMGQPAESTQA